MEASSLIKLERIARNLPAPDLELGRVDTKLGPVYIAVGRGPGAEYEGISWHGVYGFDYGDEKGIARVGEADGELTMQQAQKQFLDDACAQLARFNARDMLDPSYSLEH